MGGGVAVVLERELRAEQLLRAEGDAHFARLGVCIHRGMLRLEGDEPALLLVYLEEPLRAQFGRLAAGRLRQLLQYLLGGRDAVIKLPQQAGAPLLD
jgi:hypothetical protein